MCTGLCSAFRVKPVSQADSQGSTHPRQLGDISQTSRAVLQSSSYRPDERKAEKEMGKGKRERERGKKGKGKGVVVEK